MKTTHAVTVVAFVALLCVLSCKKDKKNISAVSYTKATADMFAALRSTPQSFTVTAGTDTKIKGAQGTILEFYPNSFKDASGGIITGGTVNIQLTELYSLGDMIANRTSTNTSYGPLTSGGEINISASMNGQEVFANKYALGFKTSGANGDAMQLYAGNSKNADSITVWTLVPPTVDTIVNKPVSISDTSWQLERAYYYMFNNCASFGWSNCDHAYDATSRQITMNITFPDNTLGSLYGNVAILYPASNLAMQMVSYQYNSDTHVLTCKGWAPDGRSCKFLIVIPKDANNWYYSLQEGTVWDPVTLNANVSLISLSQLKTNLASL